MHSNTKTAWLSACAVAGMQCCTAAAQGPVAHPADAGAAVPAALYRSPFAGYRGAGDTPVAPWRDTNDKVRPRGGARSHAHTHMAPEPVPPEPAEAEVGAARGAR